MCLKNGAQGGSRTRKTTVLSRVPMPIRLLGRMVLPVGLEPTRLSTLDPKSRVSANSTTGAHIVSKALLTTLLTLSSFPDLEASVNHSR